MNKQEETLKELKILITKEVKSLREITSIYSSLEESGGNEEKTMMESQVKELKSVIRKTMEEISNTLEDMAITKPLPIVKTEYQRSSSPEPEFKSLYKINKKQINDEIEIVPKEHTTRHKIVDVEMTDLERKTIKRIKKIKKEVKAEKIEKPSKYISFANKIFENVSHSLSKNQIFVTLKGDLIKSNMQYLVTSYISVMLLTTLIVSVFGLLIFLFFLFFNIGVQLPIITRVTESLASRFLKVFWILIAVPFGTFLAMYVYPSIERSYIENKINQELPFATIHMSAISGSMVEPSKIFSIIILTEEYPFLQREFTKLINEINIYGYDFVTALRNVAFNSPSSKLSELLNGLATTINSGGDLPTFFDKRAQTLLFDYRIEREKYTKSAETFMDIYISLVIAAPMILMLLLMMMEVSGLGISLSASMITLVMVLGVAMINIIFLTFLQLRQPTT
jgi:hypothetical protein